jgi:tetrahydromethanopterin S-methyltransferase subunit B|mmetsp:Transcript_39303/g.62252  ORF Transcript_39303/g.62252 Transcript_39303/m.62252 type:complete len:335 (-) Transcript_39303:148-1152(-)
MGDSTTTLNPLIEIAELRAQVTKLQTVKDAFLAMGGTLPPITTPAPTVTLPGLAGVTVTAETWDWGLFLAVVGVMLLLWIIPCVKPCKGLCNPCIYRVYPAITVFNLFILAVALTYLKNVEFNDIFFGFVAVFEKVLNLTKMVLMSFAGLVALLVVWKFKDRILEAIGVDNPTMVIGEFRDWATCWSMKRFSPIEVFIWKVEGLPSMHIHQANDVYVEVSSGYNNTMKTRVHYRAGASCVLKESVQLNYDPMDSSTRLYVNVKNQDVVGASDIATAQFGTIQVNRLIEPDSMQQTIGWGSTIGEENKAWKEDHFKPIDLVPSGRIWLRIQQLSK